MTTYLLASLAATFILTATLTRLLIPTLKRFAGQKILMIGPRWHKSKEGTPSMGGLSFLIAATLTICVLCCVLTAKHGITLVRPLLLSLGYALGNAAIGIIDDCTKIKKKENAGLTPTQKLVLQVVLAAAYLALLKLFGVIDTNLRLPFTDTVIPLGYAYYFFAMIILVGIVNCANLTDGIDGLASSVALVIGIFFAFTAAKMQLLPLTVISGAVIGSALGFLVYNWHPARVFMGDTGSLFFGALTASMAFMINMPILIVIVGLIYVIEGVSVILQVGYYKKTKKRLFKMAPIHHHFEKSGYSEIKIVILFSLLTALLSAVVYFGI